MDDRCHHCSGYGTVPSPDTGDTHRITCPKCDGAGRPPRTFVIFPDSDMAQMMRVLRSVQAGDALTEVTRDLADTPAPMLDERPMNRKQRRARQR